MTPKEGTELSNAILTQESTVSEVRAAAIAAAVTPCIILEVIDRRPEWAETYEVEVEEGQTVVTFSREVGTVEIRQYFDAASWAVIGDCADPVVAFYSYQDAREQGLPRPEAADVIRAVDLLHELGAWPKGAGA